MAGGERVDAGLAIHHVDLRNRNSGSDRHFFDDIQEFALVQVGRIRINQPAVEELGDRTSTAGERERLEKAAGSDDAKGAEGGGEEQRDLRWSRGGFLRLFLH